MSTVVSLNDTLLIHRQKLRRFAHNRLGKASQRMDTSDVAQNASMQVLEYMKAGVEVSDPLLVTVAHGHADKARDRHDAQCRAVSREEYSPMNGLTSRELPPDLSLEEQEWYEAIGEAIAALPEDQEYVVYRHIFDKQSLAAVARELEVSAKVVRRLLKVALDSMKRRLSE